MSYLALDLGAGSGRAIVGTFRDGKIYLDEVLRFNNTPVKLGNTLYWDFLSLFDNIKTGIRVAVKKGYQLRGIAVDTWGVDFGLIDKNGNLLSNPVCYRDQRTSGLSEKSAEHISREELYAITGIQQMDINTIFQLWAMQESGDYLLPVADKLLFMPDLVNYFLTGKAANEYTIASTSQLLDAKTREWNRDLFSKLSLPFNMAGEVVAPCTLSGKLSEAISRQTGAGDVNVFAVASHDTASAIAAIPESGDNWAFLSSGTWSLLGVLNDDPVLTQDAMLHEFTNEGGANDKILFMRNITGLWLLQCLIAGWEKEGMNASYEYILAECAKAEAFRSIIDSDDASFVNPVSMTQAIQNYCRSTGQYVPETQGELVRCILESLAVKYRVVTERLEECSGHKLSGLHIVGGGSRNEQLNQFIADALNMPVETGLDEATAIGNILQQALAAGELSGWEEAHRIVRNSFSFKTYYPRDNKAWEAVIHKIKYIFE